jgi:hypothetical protein
MDTGSPSRPIPANLIVTSRGVELTPALAGAAVIAPVTTAIAPIAAPVVRQALVLRQTLARVSRRSLPPFM